MPPEWDAKRHTPDTKAAMAHRGITSLLITANILFSVTAPEGQFGPNVNFRHISGGNLAFFNKAFLEEVRY